MNCPECGLPMWNYEKGTMRCQNDHVFATVAVEGVQEHVVRIDRPSVRERLGDVLIGVVTGGIIVAFATELLPRL